VRITDVKTGYALVALVLILEVTTFFEAVEIPMPRGIYTVPLLVLTLVFIHQEREIDIKIVITVLIVVLLIILQGVFFGVSIPTLITYPAFTLIIPYLLFKIVGYKLFEYLVTIIFYTAIVSTAIWVLQSAIPQVNDLLFSLKNNPGGLIQGERGVRVSLFFLYTIRDTPIDVAGIPFLRNPGLYHEPGAFAYFLILAIGLNTILSRGYFNKKNLIMTGILCTTFSTAGYLALFILLTFVVIKSGLSFDYKVLIIAAFVILTYVAFTQLDFMHEKIAQQYVTQVDDDSVFDSQGGRVRRIRSALYLLSTSPVIGRGIISASRDFELGSIYFFTGAGAWRTLVSYGIVFAPIIFFLYYRGITNLCRLYGYHTGFAMFFLTAILVGATSQKFFTDNITMLLFIYGLLYNLNTENE
jgi:hypothetical protein